jgi:nucleotide-binding universal stress UspA family protein
MYEKLLVAVDHSESTGRVIGAARELALLANSEVWVVHLQERSVPGKVPVGPGLSSDETTSEARASVDTIVGELTRAGINAHGEVRHTVFGYAAREIVDDAKEHDVDAIVMGSRGRGDRPVLVVR